MLVNFVPSLLHLATVKVATAIYMSREIQEFEKKPHIRSFVDTHGKEWEPFVLEKVAQCAMPIELHEKVVTLMKPLSFELNMWLADHIKIVENRRYDIYIVWNSFGMIDRSKAAERLVHSDCLPIDHRIHMACQYRMRNELQELFERAPWYDERSKVRLNLSTMFAYSQRIFPSYANSLRLFAFDSSELRAIGNIPMIHHLLKKLPPPHIIDVLKELLQRKEFLSDDDRICLFNQDAAILEQLFKRIPFRILMFLLQWPLQTQFLEVVHRLWSHLMKEEFFKLLLSIHSKIEKGWRDFDYINLIKTFWSRSPHHFQNYVQKKNISGQEEFSMHEFDIINKFLEKHFP